MNYPTVEIEIYGGSGGPEDNAIPVREDRNWGDLGFVKNGDHFLILDADKGTPAQIKEHFYAGWVQIRKLDGTLVFQCRSAVNWIEVAGHVKILTPTPTPGPGDVTDEAYLAASKLMRAWWKQ